MGYTFAQLEQLWVQAGGPASTAPIAAAVALAESGGNPRAISSTSDYGLWQINASNLGDHGLDTTTALDPLANAKAAIQMSGGGTNWSCWCTAWAHPDQDCGCGNGVLHTPQAGSAAARYVPPGTALSPVLTTSTLTGSKTVRPCSSKCYIKLPVLGCVLTGCNLKFWRGAIFVTVGGLAGLTGILMLGAYGLQRSGAQAGLARMSRLPGAGRAVAAVSGAGRRSTGRTEEQQAASHERRSRRGQEEAEEEAYRAGHQAGRASATAPPFPDA